MRKARLGPSRRTRIAVATAFVLSIALTVIVIALGVFAQFRTATVMRMSFPQTATTSDRVVLFLRTASRGVIVDHIRTRLMFDQPRDPVPEAQPATINAGVLDYRAKYWVKSQIQPAQLRFAALDFGWRYQPLRGNTLPIPTQPESRLLVYIPWWLLILPTALPAAFILAHRALFRAKRRLARGQCPKCAYDLANLPACPECNWQRPTTQPTR